MKKIFNFIFFLIALNGAAQIPAGYYDAASGQSGYTLKTTLHGIIDGHTSYSYANVWTFVNANDLTSGGKIWDIYSDIPSGTPSYTYIPSTDQCGTYAAEGDCYNREHSFPKSWFSDASPMYTDFHHLYATDGYVNGRRGSYPFGEVGTATYTSSNGSKLGTSSIVGYSGTVFEPIDEYKGDLARTYFYMATRYEDVLSTWTSDMLDGSSDQVFQTWALEMLISWHQADPVSQKEIDRNDAIYGEQGNRNPYIDHPEYVCSVWSCSGNTAPTFTSSAVTSATENSPYSYSITTNDNDGDAVTITATTKPSWLTFTDNGNGTATLTGTPGSTEVGTHSIVLNVSDGTDNTDQSFTLTVSAVGVSGLPNAWINEIHYDNASTDVGEFVEVVIEDTGYDLSLFTVSLYNGSDGGAYGTSTLDTYTLGSSSGDFDIYYMDMTNIQNGGPDGIALSYNGDLIQFLSYEGIFTATDGVASGELSTDIGVSESGSTAIGESLQLCCNGTQYSDMTWQSAATATKGAVNSGQALPITLSSFEAAVKGNRIRISWTTTSEINNEKFVMEKSTNGQEFFAIGEVAGAGNSSTLLEYTFDDRNPSSMNYYRLKQIDFDGTSTLSKVISVEFGNWKNQKAIVSPNPAYSSLYVSNVDHIESLMILDLMGRPVKVNWSKSEIDKFEINIQSLPQGTYLLVINNTGKSIFIKK